MSASDASSAEAVFARVLAGDPDVDGERFFSEHPEYRERLDDARRIAGALDEVGALRRSVLEEARALPPDAAERRLAERLVREGARTAHRRAPTWAALAAGLFFALALALWRPWETRAPEPVVDPLLGASLELSSPLGEVESFDTFRWRPAQWRGGWYVVTIFDVTDGAEVDRSSNLEQPQWRVPPERWSAWPEEIRWVVQAYDGGGRLAGSGSGRARRSP